MLRGRIIPCLLVQNKGLVKTVNFKDPKYVGDPLNAVKIYNEKEADELIVIDIDATAEGRGPDYEMIKNLAVECRMPFCYGGGISSVDQAKKIISLGAEKIAISKAALENHELVAEIGKAIGVQSVVVVIDIKKKSFLGKISYEIYVKNGTVKLAIKLEDFIKKINQIGVGEILINSIDRDGTLTGYDLQLLDFVRNLTDIPITILGGASSLNDIELVLNKYKIIGVAAGSIFVFKGKYKAVLINYPNRVEKIRLFKGKPL